MCRLGPQCSKVYIYFERWQFEMLVVVSSNFVQDTKITFGYNLKAPLSISSLFQGMFQSFTQRGKYSFRA